MPYDKQIYSQVEGIVEVALEEKEKRYQNGLKDFELKRSMVNDITSHLSPSIVFKTHIVRDQYIC